VVTNALTQSVRERLGELAVMQALGFQQRTVLLLVLAEAFTLFAAGAIVGLMLANIGFAFEIAGARTVYDVLPPHTLVMAAFHAVLCASIAAMLPCWELSKLRVSDALRRI
jgi:putative ABC transport system permease protein